MGVRMTELEQKVDIIIPTYKPDEKYDKLMERLQKQTIKPNHIYVINTMDKREKQSTDVGLKYQNMDNLTVYNITREEFDHGGTRNYGASLSKAEFVMMMTQDAVPADKCLLEKLLEPFAEEKVAAVYARQLPTEEIGPIEKYTRVFNYPDIDSVKTKQDLERLGIKTYFCSNVCAVYRKKVYEELGGFVTKTIFNEDMIMASKIIQAGYSIAYASKAKVFHAHKYTYRQQFTRNFDLGVSQKQYKEIFENVKSESEGIQLVKKTISHLKAQGNQKYIPDLICQSAFKYLGYKAGYHYDKLPQCLVKKWSMNKAYWEQDCNHKK